MPSIEYVALCDHAEINNGKLNAIGAGWSITARQIVTVVDADPAQPQPQIVPSRFAIALSLLYGWSEAGDVLSFETTIRDEDELRPPIWGGQGQISTGRPAGAPKGMTFRAFVVFLVLLPFPAPGGYIVHTVMGGLSAPHKLPFHVVDQQVFGQAQPPGA